MITTFNVCCCSFGPVGSAPVPETCFGFAGWNLSCSCSEFDVVVDVGVNVGNDGVVVDVGVGVGLNWFGAIVGIGISCLLRILRWFAGAVVVGVGVGGVNCGGIGFCGCCCCCSKVGVWGKTKGVLMTGVPGIEPPLLSKANFEGVVNWIGSEVWWCFVPTSSFEMLCFNDFNLSLFFESSDLSQFEKSFQVIEEVPPIDGIELLILILIIFLFLLLKFTLRNQFYGIWRFLSRQIDFKLWSHQWKLKKINKLKKWHKRQNKFFFCFFLYLGFIYMCRSISSEKKIQCISFWSENKEQEIEQK